MAGKKADDADDGAQESIWQRMQRPARPPRAALTHAQIGAAAVEIADAEGLDAVSMRRLAERLGVATMGLYRYVRGKDDVIELMVDAVYAEEARAGEGSDWREVLRVSALRLRALTLRHPWLVETTAQSGPLTPNFVARTDRLLASLDGLGLDADTAMTVVGTVTAFVAGATTARIRMDRLMRKEGAEKMDDLRSLYSSRMRWLLESGRYPAFERYIRQGVRKDDDDWQFELGLDSVLDGIAARLKI
ncbi:TetR/AcrR family transcriptional regulator [Microbispora catharanthi]|uniref:TetR family transcriptional regulator n=1 Tax=Microbispora catharanthi TaxID=1712871 RepID=A0A5N6C4L5_9ACTN|nr:TetR/AcrR family transcriptional regulator [Microbispora catharanthi]KAB8187744.1 TetR family transcriptional regulator [Microbispora catharanthi]